MKISQEGFRASRNDDTEKKSTQFVIPASRARRESFLEVIMKKVISVKPLEGKKVAVVFSDGASGVFDVAPYIRSDFFKRLEDDAYFKQVRIFFSGIGWPEGQDLGPDTIEADLQVQQESFARSKRQWFSMTRGDSPLSCGFTILTPSFPQAKRSLSPLVGDRGNHYLSALRGK